MCIIYLASLKEIVDLKKEIMDLKKEKKRAKDIAEIYRQQSRAKTQEIEKLRTKLFKEKFPKPTSGN